MSNFPMGFNHNTTPLNDKSIDIPSGLFMRIDNLMYAINHTFRDDLKFLTDLSEKPLDEIRESELLKVSALEAIMDDLQIKLESVDKIR